MDLSRFEELGYALVTGVVDADLLARLCELLAEPIGQPGQRRGGRRGLLQSTVVRELATSAPVRAIVDAILSPRAGAVRGIAFDKHADSNWSVRWHRDATIAVRERIDTAGYYNWSEKDGVVHVSPPPAVLDRMLTIRVHLDACDATQGALLVHPGSHRLPSGASRPESEPVTCAVAAGDAVVMRPRLFHASEKAVQPTRRRVIHLEFSEPELPGGLVFVELLTAS